MNKILGEKEFVKKMLVPNKFGMPKICIKKSRGPKNIFCPNKFGALKIKGSKIFWV